MDLRYLCPSMRSMQIILVVVLNNSKSSDRRRRFVLMTLLDTDTVSPDTAQKYEKEATDIVFSLPELSPAEQAALLIKSTKSGDAITMGTALRAIEFARRTF